MDWVVIFQDSTVMIHINNRPNNALLQIFYFSISKIGC